MQSKKSLIKSWPLVILATLSAFQVEAKKAPNKLSEVGLGQISSKKIESTVLAKIPNAEFAAEKLKQLKPETQKAFEKLMTLLFLQGTFENPAPQFGILMNSETKQLDFKDASEMELTTSEKEILNFLILMQSNGDLNYFLASLKEYLIVQYSAQAQQAAVADSAASAVNDNNVVSPLATTPKQAQTIAERLKSLPPDQFNAAIMMFTQIVESEKYLKDFKTPSWVSINQKLSQYVQTLPESSQQKISDENFVNDLASLSSFQPASFQDYKLLVNGPSSFQLRDQMIPQAKKSIDMIVWAVLDDETGIEMADQFIAKAKEIPVRLMIDGHVAQRDGYSEQIKRMEANGVQVIRWMNPQAQFMGQHRKILIIDGSSVITGGMNPGNDYSHKNGPGSMVSTYWRDTDVYFSGEAVKSVNQLFAKLWNEQLVINPLYANKYASISFNSDMQISSVMGSSDTVQMIEHRPGGDQDQQEVLKAILKIVRSAQSTLDIENAYVVMFPVLKAELVQAMQRGVKVRVLTNSIESVDEPTVSQPILRSALLLAQSGIEVYAKKGSTLHSKFLVADDQIFMIGSYNLHPRSATMEGETVFIFNSSSVAKEAREQFEKDIAPDKADRVTLEMASKLKVDANMILVLRMFINQI